MGHVRGLALAALLLAAASGPAFAGPAITVIIPGSVFDSTPFTLGSLFSVATSANVTALGIFNNGDQLTSPGQVGIWDTSGHLLTSVAVPTSGATVIGDFVYAPIVPFTLIAGVDYVIGSYSAGAAGSSCNIASMDGACTVDPNVTIVQDQFEDGATFKFPDLTNGYLGGAWLGANFFTGSLPVPEPASLILFGSALAGLGALRASRRS